MDRRKLIYNAISDLWQLANKPYFQKSKKEMSDDDWQLAIKDFDSTYQKYTTLPDRETTFAFEIINALMNLVEREDRINIEVKENPSSCATYKRIWVTKETAKRQYGINIPDEDTY